MSGYRNNLFSTCMGGIGAVYILSLSLIFVLLLGGLLGLWIAEGITGYTNSMLAAFWFGGIIVGLLQLWGIIAYTLIAFHIIALFRVDTYRWMILISILLTQTSESARMLINFNDHGPWLHALAVAGMILPSILCAVAYYYLNRDTAMEEAPYTDCRSCGYNLAGTLRDNRTECPECGQPVTEYQRVQSNLDRQKHLT